MCNHCDCMYEMHHSCSILGHMPKGFCCENCIGYENRFTCENYVIHTARYVNNNVDHLKIISEEKAKITTKQKTIATTTTINKDR
jgi:hypothetical protein